MSRSQSRASSTPNDGQRSPYRRDNYFSEDDPSQSDGDVDAPDRDWGQAHHFKQNNDVYEIIAHKLLREGATKLCASTLFDEPWNGGRTAELVAWLCESEPIDGHGGALHHENREVELTDPELHIAKRAGEQWGTREYGQFRHRRRYNPETGYVTGGESTAVILKDRPTEEFMQIVSWYLREVRDDLPPKLVEEGTALAKQLKTQGSHRDIDIMSRVVEHVRTHY